MTVKQSAIIIAAVILAVALYFVRSAPEDKNALQLLAEGAREELDEAGLKELNELERQQNAYEHLSDFWLRHENTPLAAMNALRAADKAPSKEAYVEAGDLLMEAHGAIENDQDLMFFFIKRAEVAYTKALELDPDDLEVKLALAKNISQAQGNVMEGVKLLREITQADPGNVEANMILGRFSITSGQYEKAVERLQTVVENDPEHLEGWVLLADVYEVLGQNENAINAFNQAKEIAPSQELKESIDKRIERLK